MRCLVRVTVLSILLINLVLPALPAQNQRKSEPLTEGEIINLLQGGVPPERVESLARDHGISFQVTPPVERDLRDAGANDALLGALREIAAKPAAAVVLTIQSTPGGAQVFVDDGLIARTSPEGRLKLSTLTPGRHRVRLAFEGYRDYEQTIDLTPGPNTVTATLQAVPASPPPPAKPVSNPTPSPSPHSSVRRAYLGIMMQSLTPETARTFRVPDALGVVIRQVDPRGPAAAAGLMVGDVVRSFNGQPLKKAEDLAALVGEQAPGTEVTLEFLRNGLLQTTTVRLTAPPSDLDKAVLVIQGPVRGLTLSELTELWRRTLSLPAEAQGLVVTGIEPNSPAAAAGFTIGDVIEEINRTKVQSLKDASTLAGNTRGRLLLLVNRKGKQIHLELRAKP